MEIKIYSKREIRDILLNKRLHNTLVWKELIKSTNIKTRKLLEQSTEYIINLVDNYVIKSQVDDKYITLLQHHINRLIVINLISNYYHLQQSASTIDDYLLIDSELNRLCDRDKHLLLGYYQSKYSYEELESIAKEKGLRINRTNISDKINVLVDYITNSLTDDIEDDADE
jgi:single-stranded DNA-specific DHH superfamily exonuclease